MMRFFQVVADQLQFLLFFFMHLLQEANNHGICRYRYVFELDQLYLPDDVAYQLQLARVATGSGVAQFFHQKQLSQCLHVTRLKTCQDSVNCS